MTKDAGWLRHQQQEQIITPIKSEEFLVWLTDYKCANVLNRYSQVEVVTSEREGTR
jgi:hypothetical protein